MLNLTPYCGGCGAVFSVEHALDCWVGGLIGQRHNELHDAIGGLTSLAWDQVQKEPVICEETVDSCDPSCRSQSPEAVLHKAEVEKKKYSAACLACRSSFTHLCFSVDGMFGTKARFFLHRLADRLSSKLERPYSLVMGWIQARLLFAGLRATMHDLCETIKSKVEVIGRSAMEY